MATLVMTSTHHQFHSRRSSSQPVNHIHQSSPPRSIQNQNSPPHSYGYSRSKTPEEAITDLAALPSLSKSLNHLPVLGLNDRHHISVYEGMPSRAQAKSHEKLKNALAMTPSPSSSKRSSFSQERTSSMYTPHCPRGLTMTPAHPQSAPSSSPPYTLGTQSSSDPRYSRPQSRSKFTVGGDEESEEEDDD